MGLGRVGGFDADGVDFFMLDPGCWILDARFWMLGRRFRIKDSEYRIQDTEYRIREACVDDLLEEIFG